MYEWVKSHQNERLPWRLLSLEEQLNTTCDALANDAMARALCTMRLTSKPTLLPFEKAAIVIGGTKITFSIAQEIRYHLGKTEAKNFYINTINRVHGSNKGGLGWSAERFDSVDWRAIVDTIATRVVWDGL